MHRDLKISNMFVTHARNLELAALAVGDFGAAQEGDLNVRYKKEQTGVGMSCRATVRMHLHVS